MLQLVQPGEGENRNLLIWIHDLVSPELKLAAKSSCILYLYEGPKTSNYENTKSIEEMVAFAKQSANFTGKFEKIVLGAFAAGGRAVQKKLLETLEKGIDSEFVPHAVILIDALYAPYLKNSTVVDSASLYSIIKYAKLAAKDQDRYSLSILHSSIRAAGYATSEECAKVIRTAVRGNGSHLVVELFDEELEKYKKELVTGGKLSILHYLPATSEEQGRLANLADEAINEFCPWLSLTTSSEDKVYFPEVTVEAQVKVPSQGLQAAALELADKDLQAKVKESSRNSGKDLEKYFKEFGVPQPNNWCACATGFWIRTAAANLGIKAPIKCSAGAKATMAQLQEAGLWTPTKNVDKSKLKPGSVVIWHRGDPSSWTGHIGLLEKVLNETTFQTIEGNSGPKGDAVARMVRTFTDPQLLGFGSLEGKV